VSKPRKCFTHLLLETFLLAKKGYSYLPGSAKTGWDIVVVCKGQAKCGSGPMIAKVKVMGTTEEEFHRYIALRCSTTEYTKGKDACSGVTERCYVVVVEKVARDPRIRIIDTCLLPDEVLKELRIKLPNDVLKHASSIKLVDL